MESNRFFRDFSTIILTIYKILSLSSQVVYCKTEINTLTITLTN